MKHNQALVDSLGNLKNPDGCKGELKAVGSFFAGDVYWIVYQCQECGKKIATVNGYSHWWNYELKEEENPSSRKGEF